MDKPSGGRASRRFARVLACASALLLVVCGDPLGPRGAGDPLRASLSFAPAFPAGAAAALSAASVNVDNVHIVLRRADGTVVLDTIVAFPAGVDEIQFAADVKLRGVSEMFVALIQLRSGSIVLFEGTQNVEARAGLAAAQTVTITTKYAGPVGSLTYADGSGARLRMNNSAASLIVGGSASFNASDMGDADLTAGLLEIRGNFSASLNNFQSYRASGTHVTRFSGTAPQSIFFYYPADNRSRFQNVEFAPGTVVSLASSIVAAGNASVASTASIVGSRISMGGLLSTTTGSSLGGLTDVFVYQPGATFPQIRGSGPTMVYLGSGGTISLPVGNTALPGSLTVTSGTTLDIGTSALSIAGSLTYANGSGARLKMTNAAARLVVSGDAYFNAADMGDNDLTAGTMEIAGNFTAQLNNFQSFRATGSHLTRFIGTGGQNVYFYYPSPSQSLFANVEFANSSAAGVSFGSNVFAGAVTQGGRLTVPTALSISGALTLGPTSITNVTGSLSKASCTAASGAQFTGFTCP